MKKKGARGSGSIRKREDGLWEGRITVGRDPRTGKQTQKSVYGKTKEEVRKKVTAETKAVDDGTYIEPSRITFGAWLDIWLNDYCPNIKPRTRLLYASSINSRIKPGLGAQRMDKLTPALIQIFYNSSQKESSEGQDGLSPKSIRNMHGIIHKALQKAVELGYLKKNPSDKCELPKVSKPNIVPMDKEHIKAFVNELQDEPLRRMYLVALFTGMRLGEIIGLTWDNVNFKTGTIKISQQMQRFNGSYRMVPPKNGKPRTIAPAPFVLDLLREEQKSQEQQRETIGRIWSNDLNLVFTNAIGANHTHRILLLHLKKHARAIGMPDLRFHDLRHTYAVTAITEGVDYKTVSENLGHSSVAFTMDTYVHLTGDMQRTSAEKMQQYIDGLNL